MTRKSNASASFMQHLLYNLFEVLILSCWIPARLFELSLPYTCTRCHQVSSRALSFYGILTFWFTRSQQKKKRKKTEMHYRIAVPKLSLNMENVKLAKQCGKQLTRSFFLCAGTQSNWGRTGNNQTLDPHIILAQIYRYQMWCRCRGEEGREWV